VERKALLKPFAYITSHPGKGMVGRIVRAFNVWLDVPKDKLKIIKGAVSKLHSASLLCVTIVEVLRVLRSNRIDDIEDDSLVRRGQPGAFFPV
jgi:geranylgeranyl diphosphate synthase type 3